MHFISHAKKQLTLTLDLAKQVRSITYSDRYQLLFVACFELEVSVFELNPVHCDFIRKESRIKGDSVMVFVKKRPNSSTLITYDETKCLKLWNIVDMVCYQSVQTHLYTPIQVAVCLYQRLIVAVHRLGDYRFVEAPTQEKKAVEALTIFDEALYLAVNGTIRCVSLRTGKCEQILETGE